MKKGDSILTLDRIVAKCEWDGDCLLWRGKVGPQGNPAATERIDGKDKYVAVRRRTFLGYHPEVVGIKSNERINTKCGNHACLAPDHLIKVTTRQQAKLTVERISEADKMNRARKISEKMRRHSVITPEMLEEIRRSTDGPYVTAKRLGIKNGSIVCRIMSGTGHKDYRATPFSGLL